MKFSFKSGLVAFVDMFKIVNIEVFWVTAKIMTLTFCTHTYSCCRFGNRIYKVLDINL